MAVRHSLHVLQCDQIFAGSSNSCGEEEQVEIK